MTRSLARLMAMLLISLAGLGAAAAIERPYLVVDLDSGRVLSERNANQLWYPASITKLMNAYVTFKALREGRVAFGTPVIVSKNALAEPPSKMGFKVGTAIDLDNALKMMMVHSSNDIAVAIAETVGGSEAAFVARMNAEAARLGMASTRFVNPNGLPGAGQYTTARDLAVLARALWTEFPQYRPLFGITAIRSGKKVMKSANSLLERYPGTIGMKTGFICSSGFNVVAAAHRNGRTLAAVVLGSDNSKDRAELAGRLLSNGFAAVSKSGSAPTLASLRGSSPVPQVIDMRDYICKAKDRGEHEAETEKAGVTFESVLVPKFKLMDPVPVTTLGMLAADGTIRPASEVVAKDGAAKKAKKSAKSKATADIDPAVKPKPVKKPAKKAAKPDASADAGTAAPTRASAKGSVPRPKPKLEVGVPFDSTDIAPLPATQ